MTDTELIIAIAKLDGEQFSCVRCGRYFAVDVEVCPNCGVDYKGKIDIANIQGRFKYLTSRDAIIPVIEKCCPKTHWQEFHIAIAEQIPQLNENTPLDENVHRLLLATPKQLCIALLKATNHWK